MVFSVMYSQVMEATGDFHARIRQPGLFVPKDIFDNSASFDSGDSVLHANSKPRQLAIGALLRGRKLASGRLFFLGWQT